MKTKGITKHRLRAAVMKGACYADISIIQQKKKQHLLFNGVGAD